MNPVSQSHSVPLLEGICHTISDMNADCVMVTQETLVAQLMKNYPGMAVPSHNILHNILGTLIKERKIYHTGEGYFIVTPNTYFTTNDITDDNGRVPLEDTCCCSLPSITYVVNIEFCAGLVKENIPMVSHYRSCHCFPDQNMLFEQRQLMNHETNGGAKKGCSDLKPSIQSQGISTFVENHSRDTAQSLGEKLKCKRFGLGLFWRRASKKEKLKKEYSTFSAQFPPKEWPVRDEDDLDNIPRDVEHEIIKRINPTLTVDNLIKHTILMQKLEEQKKCISKGTSADVSAVRQNHLSKDCAQKPQNKTAKDTRKTKSNNERQISRSNRKSHVYELTSQNEPLEENFSLPVRNQQPSDVAVESHVIYKRQIKNPFQGLSWRRSSYVKGHKGTMNSQLKSRTQKQERALKSLDSSKTFEYGTEQLAVETKADKVKQNKLLHASKSSLQLKKGSLSENFSYLHDSTLQVENKCKQFLESTISEENVHRRTVKTTTGDIKKYPHSYTGGNGVCREDAKLSLNLKDECCRCRADTVCELLDQTANEFQNAHLSNDTANVSLVENNGVKYRQKTDNKSELIFKDDGGSHSGSMKLESKGFIENCNLVHQKARDGDTCSLLHPDHSWEVSEPPHLPPGYSFADTRDWGMGVQELGTGMSLKTYQVNAYPTQCNTTVSKPDSGEHRYKESTSFAESKGVLKEHPNTDFTEEGWLCSQVLPIVYRKAEETGLTECSKASAVADVCLTDEAGSDADTLQSSTIETGKVASCALGSHTNKRRNPLGGKDLFFKNACTVASGQKHSEGTENHSITGDSGIDSPRWTEKKMKLPAKF